MDSQQTAKVRELFDTASELPPLDRAAFLNEHCSDPAIRKRVDVLLASHDSAEKFLSTPAADLTSLHTFASDSEPQSQGPDPLLNFTLGQYTITGILGAGGMGIVYRAEQAATQRPVAIKVIRSTFADPGLLRRFSKESLVLGRLKHPGIAQIYEAGTAPGPDGRELPFFAMEFVAGQPLLAFASTIGLREKLELFARVCDAVNHAHQKGVIHRDLKPGNILIEEDSTTAAGATGSTHSSTFGPQPKILDFGVARLTDLDAAAATMQTDVGQVIGTLAYMSPEQIRGESDRLDTRSDIYALGVILCELLTGQLPYSVKGKPLAQAARIIGEDDPTLNAATSKLIRGDVETIILKALAKEPERRYQSAAELSADIRRFLADQPIVARPATATYQLRKFASRNKALVGGIIATILVLTLGIIGTSIGMVKAREAQKLALKREEKATLEARKATRAIDFLVGMLTSADPDRQAGREVTVRELLDSASSGVDQELKDEPEIRRTLHNAIERTYRAIGTPDKSLAHIEEVKKITSSLEGEASIEYAFALHEQALSLNDAGDWKAARDIATQALTLLEAKLPPGDIRLASVCSTICGSHLSLGEMQAAEEFARRGYRLATDAANQAEIATTATLLVEVMERKGGKDTAAEVDEKYKLVIDISTKLHGPEHSKTTAIRGKYAYFLGNQQRDPEAVQLFHEVIAAYTKLYGPSDRRTLDALSNLSTSLVDVGDFAGADAASLKAIEGLRVNSPESADLASAIGARGGIAARRKDFALAEECHREALRIRIARGSVNTTTSMANLASALRAQAKYEEAADYSLQAIERRRAANALMTDFGVMLSNHGDILSFLGKDVEAEKYFKDSLAFDLEKRPGNPANALNMRAYAVFLQKRARYSEAEPLARQAYDLTAKLSKTQRARVVDCLIGVLESVGKTDEAASLRAEYDLPPAATAPAAPK